MSAPKRLRARRYDTQPKLLRMLDLEPEDASWVCYPNSAWLAIESKAEAALMHQNIEFQWGHVDGYELADFLNETFDSDWRRAPVREHAVRVNQLQRLRDQIDRGHWVVLGWTECNMVEWVDDAGVLGGGRWQLRWQWKSIENGSALVRHLNEVTQRRWRASTPNRTPLSEEPFRAQFDTPKPGVLVADRSGAIWPTMGGSRARTDEEELTGASGRSGDWTSQSKTDLMAQGVAHGLNVIAGGGGMLPPGANPGMVLAGAAVRALARVVPGYVPSNATLNSGSGNNESASNGNSSSDAYDRVYGSRTSVENVTSRGTSIETVPNSNDLTALNDFAALQPKNVKTVSTGRGDVSIGTLDDGSAVILRPSKDGRTTIEFQNGNGRTTREIRYGSK